MEIHSIYGYDYLKTIILRRADSNDYTISEGDFKHLRANDFEDLYLLHLQGKLHHLNAREKKTLVFAVLQWIRGLVIRKRVEDLQLGIESYQRQINLTRPRWEVTGLQPMADYTVIDSPSAVIFRDKYNVPMMMRQSELHKFSDGTLERVDEALDYRVKDYKIYSKKGRRYTNNWTDKEMKMTEKFINAIRYRLKMRRIYRSLESYVGGRVREGHYLLLTRTD